MIVALSWDKFPLFNATLTFTNWFLILVLLKHCLKITFLRRMGNYMSLFYVPSQSAMTGVQING